MMIRLKPILITGLFSFTLAATALSHADASLTATAALKQAKTVASTKETTTTQPIIAYFEKDAGTSSEHENSLYSATPVADGYYRILHGRDKNGRFLVQDFYQEGQKKQTDPFWIVDEEGLNSFEIHYVDGEVRNYFKNGKLSTINVVKDGEFKGTTVSNYLTGKHATEFELIDPEKYIYTVKYWYDDGKPAMDGQVSYEDSEEGDYTVKAWDRQGNTVTDQAEIQKIAADISKILEEAE